MVSKKDSVDRQNPFKQAVEATSCISGGYCPGIQALGANKRAISATDSHQLDGSVDIDKQTKQLYSEASRWDYAIGYAGKAYFVEVHPASTSDVDTILKKAKWLNGWLANDAPELKKLMPNNTLYWVATKRCDIRGTKKKGLAQGNILLAKQLHLPPEEGNTEKSS